MNDTIRSPSIETNDARDHLDHFRYLNMGVMHTVLWWKTTGHLCSVALGDFFFGGSLLNLEATKPEGCWRSQKKNFVIQFWTF